MQITRTGIIHRIDTVSGYQVLSMIYRPTNTTGIPSHKIPGMVYGSTRTSASSYSAWDTAPQTPAPFFLRTRCDIPSHKYWHLCLLRASYNLYPPTNASTSFFYQVPARYTIPQIPGPSTQISVSSHKHQYLFIVSWYGEPPHKYQYLFSLSMTNTSTLF